MVNNGCLSIWGRQGVRLALGNLFPSEGGIGDIMLLQVIEYGGEAESHLQCTLERAEGGESGFTLVVVSL